MASNDDSKEKDGKGGGIMPLIIAAVISVVVGLGAGYGTIVTFAPPKSPDVAAKPAEAPAAEAHGAAQAEKKEEKAGGHGGGGEGEADAEEQPPEPVDPNDVAYIPLAPVITNLTDPKTVWLRLEGGITYLKSGEKKPDVLAAESAQQIVQYIRTIRLADVEGQDGLQFLQDDLNDITRSLSNGQVQSVLISGLIVE